MITRDPCGCRDCNEARMLAAWVLLAEEESLEPRLAARMLLRRWDRVAGQGTSPLAFQPSETEVRAMEVCAAWIREHEGSLRNLHRHVGVSGTPAQ
jgi:hypothetical protein